MSKILHVGQLNLPDADLVMSRNRAFFENYCSDSEFTLLRKVEQKFAQFLDVKHCIMTSNGTTSIMLALRSLEARGGGNHRAIVHLCRDCTGDNMGGVYTSIL